jgi:hypothetical protein
LSIASPSPDKVITCRFVDSGKQAVPQSPGETHWPLTPWKRIQQPAFTVHREVARCPHLRRANVAGKDPVLRHEFVDCFCDILWMNRLLACFTDCKVIHCRAGFLVVLNRSGKVGRPTLCLDDVSVLTAVEVDEASTFEDSIEDSSCQILVVQDLSPLRESALN